MITTIISIVFVIVAFFTWTLCKAAAIDNRKYLSTGRKVSKGVLDEHERAIS